MIETKMYRPAELDAGQWRLLQEAEREAYAETLQLMVPDRTYIDELVSWNSPRQFELSHTNPQCQVGKRFNFNQVITHPRVLVAYENGELVGWASGAFNASYGDPEGPQDDSERARFIRALKLASIVVPPPFSAYNKNYFAIRDWVTVPERMQEGIGRRVLHDLVRRAAVPWQHVALYDWPDVDPEWMRPMFERQGFHETGEPRPAHVFGRAGYTVLQARLQADTAQSVVHNTRQSLG